MITLNILNILKARSEKMKSNWQNYKGAYNIKEMMYYEYLDACADYEAALDKYNSYHCEHVGILTEDI